MEYTKGEWKVNDTGVNYLWVESNKVKHVICMVLQPEWTEVRGANYQPEEAKANAHLIAAAPDMYEALKGLMRDYSTNPNSDIFYKACLKAREALAKAEGK